MSTPTNRTSQWHHALSFHLCPRNPEILLLDLWGFGFTAHGTKLQPLGKGPLQWLETWPLAIPSSQDHGTVPADLGHRTWSCHGGNGFPIVLSGSFSHELVVDHGERAGFRSGFDG